MGKRGHYLFFVPSYVTADKITLDTGLKWTYTDSAKTALQYDTVQEVLFRDPESDITTVKKICFKQSANLHTIFIDLETASLDSITKDDFVETNVRVITPDGNISYDEPGNFIKGRGNSTWELDKKPYFLKLAKKSGLCGMEPDKKWILLANAGEATKIANKLFYDFSKDAGLHFSADSEWADLYISGGYILEKDVTIADSPCGFVTDDGNCFVITSPDNASLTEAFFIQSYFQNIENLLNLQDASVLQYIDTDSFARRFLIEETALNSDAFITSCYFYKKRNDNRIYAGPLWDFDSVLGESDSVDHEEMGNVWLNYDETTVLSMDENRATTAVLPWDEQLYELPEYRNILERTYRKLLPQFEALLNEQIDIYADQVRQSVALDSIRWDYAETEAGHYSSFDNNIRYMKFFLAKRINFLNRQFGLEEYPYENTSGAAHNITCVIGGQEIIIPVEDGSFLNPDMLPPYDKENHTGWIYEWDHTPLSEYLPVYEDLTLYLE